MDYWVNDDGNNGSGNQLPLFILLIQVYWHSILPGLWIRPFDQLFIPWKF